MGEGNHFCLEYSGRSLSVSADIEPTAGKLKMAPWEATGKLLWSYLGGSMKPSRCEFKYPQNLVSVRGPETDSPKIPSSHYIFKAFREHACGPMRAEQQCMMGLTAVHDGNKRPLGFSGYVLKSRVIWNS